MELFLWNAGKKWKVGQEERDKQTTKKERLQRAKEKSLACKKQEVQRKITSMLEKLPEKERDKIESDERTEMRKERQRMKQELWKYRDKNSKCKNGPDKKILRKKGENERMRERMEKILETRKRIEQDEKKEEERRKQRLDQLEHLKQKRKREEQERMLKREETRKNEELKKIQARRIELAREIYKYNEEYEQTSEEQKKTIIGEKLKILQEWDKKTRMEKIKILKLT